MHHVLESVGSRFERGEGDEFARGAKRSKVAVVGVRVGEHRGALEEAVARCGFIQHKHGGC